jgi:hypothetical protein
LFLGDARGAAQKKKWAKKYMRGVFELLLPRNAQKRTKKKLKGKKVWVVGVGGWV